MLKTLALAGAICCALFSSVEARQRHATGLDPSCGISMSCQAPSESSPQARREARGRYISGAMGGFGGPVTPRAMRVRHVHHVQSYGAPSPSIGYTVGRPARYVGGHLICAVNVGIALAERGIKGTGSALALSYLHWGHSAGGPVPGAVIVSSRRGGGHVAIVSRVENGVVYAWNATGGQSGWREIPYRHRVLDYRVPG